MQVSNNELTLSPTDLVHHIECRHLTALERERAYGRLKRPHFTDLTADLVTQHGLLHEQRYLQALKDDGHVVVEIDGGELHERVQETADAMHSGADVIYQATFAATGWSGQADFLRKVSDDKSRGTLGGHLYEPYDTKLARSARATALVQLAEYASYIATIQGCDPEFVHLILGDASLLSFPLTDIAPYYRMVRQGFVDDLETNLLEVYPEPVEHCHRCHWRSTCVERRLADDHLTLVADLGRVQARKLEEAGITTLTDLAGLAESAPVSGVQQGTIDRLRHQARLQLDQRLSGDHTFDLLEPLDPLVGLEALPAPTSDDIFFDIEGDPFLGPHGLEYLFGRVDNDGHYVAGWATSVDEEKTMLEEFIDLTTEKFDANPAMHVFHYGHYEPTTLKRLATQHGTRELELDHLLRHEVFVDLHRIVKAALRASIDSYSIKRLEVFYRERRETEISSGIGSAVAFEGWLGSDDRTDRTLLEAVEEYNGDDCESARLLRDWLEGLRPQLEAMLDRPLERPVLPTPTVSDATIAADSEVASLQESLLDGISDDPLERTDEEDARWKLAHMLSWHRREMRTEWWAYFDRRELDDVDRFDHPECIADLEHQSSDDPVRGNTRHTYRFDPAQELKIRDDARLEDPATGKGAGAVKEFDVEAGVLALSRRSASAAPHPRSLMVGTPIEPKAQKSALRAIADKVVTGDDGGVALKLLRRVPPAPVALSQDAANDLVQEACQRALALDADFLAIQGPPGAGKTYAGSHIVTALVDAGKTVAISAHSHAVIHNLLKAVLKDSPTIRIRKVGSQDPELPADIFTDNPGLKAALDAGEVDVIAGTTFALCRDEFAGQVDTVIIDEAGQMSLANAMAVTQVARNLVLLGDPQQLNQPTKASHPTGTDVSALGHLLGEHDTMPAQLGMFLPETRRMHENLTGFVSERFYDGRLKSHALCNVQALEWPTVGHHLCLVDHEHRSSESPEEAAAVRELLRALHGQTWTPQNGEPRPLTLADILVVAPFNAQVRALKRVLDNAARVGTVDLFQGQEAPVVIYSMAASSAELAPRGMDFLYDLHRMNVAVSRAQGAAIVVCSPRLLKPSCSTPEQVRLVSALCRYAETATPVGEPPELSVTNAV